MLRGRAHTRLPRNRSLVPCDDEGADEARPRVPPRPAQTRRSSRRGTAPPAQRAPLRYADRGATRTEPGSRSASARRSARSRGEPAPTFGSRRGRRPGRTYQGVSLPGLLRPPLRAFAPSRADLSQLGSDGRRQRWTRPGRDNAIEDLQQTSAFVIAQLAALGFIVPDRFADDLALRLGETSRC